MQQYVLGFDQAKISSIKDENGKPTDLTDLLILQYVTTAQANPKMYHKTDEEGISYVWLLHSHILDDLPILNISEGRLKNRLTRLRKMGLLQSITSSKTSKGSRTFYSLTKEAHELLYTSQKSDASDNYTSQKSDASSITRHKKVTSDNKQYSNDNKPKSNNTNVLLDVPSLSSKNKQNLYQKCVSQIDISTQNSKLRKALLAYLSFRLQIPDKRLYAPMWKGMLNKLFTEWSDDNTRIKVVQTSMIKGWLNFYAEESYSKTSKNVAVSIEGLKTKSQRLTKEEKEHVKQQQQNGTAIRI